jgi:hypothetical protein
MYAITSQVYTNLQFDYKNILTINKMPQGPMAQITRRLNIEPRRISAFRAPNEQHNCVYALYNSDNNEPWTVNELPDFFTFCQANNYKVETELTQMLNKNTTQLKNVLCYISLQN